MNGVLYSESACLRMKGEKKTWNKRERTNFDSFEKKVLVSFIVCFWMLAEVKGGGEF